MSGLFLRFYFGVLFILLVAFFVQDYVFRASNDTRNVRIIEQALSGSVRLALDRMQGKTGSAAEAAFLEVRDRFEYRSQWLEIENVELDPSAEARLLRGDVVYQLRDGNGYVAGKIPDSSQILLFGPLPTFVTPSRSVVTLGLGLVLTTAALAIAILLRPVVSQLREVEQTALAIAEGDLSARVTLPIRPINGTLPLGRAFNTMARRVEKLLKSQQELLQAVSHELRTPLARLRFATDLLQTSKSETQKAKRMESIDRAIENLENLVNELLTYIRLDSPDPLDSVETFDVTQSLQEILQPYQYWHPHLDFRIQAVPSQILVWGDRVSLERAVENLLRNAARFARRSVVLACEINKSRVVLDIKDDGPGVSESECERIFDPFVRLDPQIPDATPATPEVANSTLNQNSGVGLGLAIVRRIAAQHGGSVSCEFSPFGGGHFRLILPAVER